MSTVYKETSNSEIVILSRAQKQASPSFGNRGRCAVVKEDRLEQKLQHSYFRILRALVTFQNINYYGKGCEVNALYFITLRVQCTSHISVLNELEIIK